MMGVWTRPASRSIRTRILLIAWVPSLALLIVGGLFVAYLGVQASKSHSNSELLRNSTLGSYGFTTSIQTELARSAAVIANDKLPLTDLEASQAASNQAFAVLSKVAEHINVNSGTQDRATNNRINLVLAGLPEMRKRVIQRGVSLVEVQNFYGQIIDLLGEAMSDLGRQASSGDAAIE